MKDTITKLEQLLISGNDYMNQASEEELTNKPKPDKWSKQEILGHLIDSGVNNLRRFTEIQFEPKPYKIIRYNQDELVKANNYQGAQIGELSDFWLTLNKRILKVMQNQTDTSLNFEIELPDGEASDLKFLMTDYVEHLEYHLNQIIASS